MFFLLIKVIIFKKRNIVLLIVLVESTCFLIYKVCKKTERLFLKLNTNFENHKIKILVLNKRF